MTEIDKIRKEIEKIDIIELFKKRKIQKSNEKFCKQYGHDYISHPYCDINGINYLTCKKCGKEITN